MKPKGLEWYFSELRMQWCRNKEGMIRYCYRDTGWNTYYTFDIINLIIINVFIIFLSIQLHYDICNIFHVIHNALNWIYSVQEINLFQIGILLFITLKRMYLKTKRNSYCAHWCVNNPHNIPPEGFT